MASSTLITDYLGKGLAAARPSSPPVASGALALYLATDTGNLSRWDGSAWTSLSSVWREGSGAPSSGLGIDGDFYLNGTTSDVYLKATGTYSIVCNIKGATGATGSAGATGATGPTGPAGTFAAIADADLVANVSGGSLAPTGVALSGYLDYVLGPNQGAILYRSGTGWVEMLPGTAGEVLTTGGASADPTWTVPAGTYTLPTASTTVLGGVKVDGTTVTITGGVISSAGASVTVAATAPGSPATGNLWWSTTDGNLYIYDGAWALAVGATGNSRQAARLQAQWASGAIVANSTIYFAYDAPYDGTINSMTHLCTTGSFTVAVQINGTPVTGLGAVSPTSTPTTTNATAANTFTAGQRISGVITSASGSPTDVLLSLNVTWAA
jgi:hypothetical protein